MWTESYVPHHLTTPTPACTWVSLSTPLSLSNYMKVQISCITGRDWTDCPKLNNKVGRLWPTTTNLISPSSHIVFSLSFLFFLKKNHFFCFFLGAKNLFFIPIHQPPHKYFCGARVNMSVKVTVLEQIKASLQNFSKLKKSSSYIWGGAFCW